MPDVSPGSDSYEEALRRVASIMQQHEEELAEIDRTSEISFRLWLDKVVQDVAGALGIGLAKAEAFIADVLTIVGNAGRTFKREYIKNYEKSRQIKPR